MIAVKTENSQFSASVYIKTLKKAKQSYGFTLNFTQSKKKKTINECKPIQLMRLVATERVDFPVNEKKIKMKL